MKTNNAIPILAIIGVITLSGCAESQTMGSTVGKGAMKLVDSFATGVQQGIDRNFPNSSNQTIATPNIIRTTTVTPTKASNAITSEDTVYLFGWMEDACTGENPAYKEVKANHSKFIESFHGRGRQNFVKPRSEWSPEYQDMIKDINYKDLYDTDMGGDFGEYTIIFEEGVRYRGQPLDQYIYSYRRESSGGVESLKFAPNANVSAIWPNFKTRTVESWDEMIDMGANYTPQTKTINCEYD